jgi:diguanylate cyclase (GGDEF)-like protein
MVIAAAPPSISRDVQSEETRFVALQLNAQGRILEYAGIDLPDICLYASASPGANLLDLWAGTEPLYSFALRLLAGETASLTARVMHPDYLSPRMHRLFGSTVIVEGEQRILVHAFRIPNNYVQSRAYQETLRTAAETDVLTNAVNRRRFNQELAFALDLERATGHPGAVLYMDLDDFKAVNDTLGHAAGDELLISITRCLKERLREQDVLGRLGGDEFAVLMPGLSANDAADVARSLLRAVREHRVSVQDRAISTTMSVGVALYPEHGTTAGEILAHADSAMYKVKDSGRNEVAMFDPREDSKANSSSRLRWKVSIADALSNDKFLFYAQPIVDLQTGMNWRHEVLLRMRDARGRLIAPAAFLGVAERSGFMHDIDYWVSHEAMRLCELLKDAPDAGISFNLSPTALKDEELLRDIEKTLVRSQIEPSQVCIEVTEAAAVSDSKQATRFLRRLKNLGARIALDDFGAGFSSFSQLKSLPVDYLKIDGSFIKDLPRSTADQHFVRAIAEVSRGLGMQVIAEFVGDAETVALLREYGIEYGQGYYLGRPVSTSSAFPRLRHGVAPVPRRARAKEPAAVRSAA